MKELLPLEQDRNDIIVPFLYQTLSELLKWQFYCSMRILKQNGVIKLGKN